MAKSLMKAVLGISTSKLISLASSALLTTWLVMTRWRDEESFQAWLASPSFAHGHRSAAERAGGDAPKPVATHSEVWSYVIAGGSTLDQA